MTEATKSHLQLARDVLTDIGLHEVDRARGIVSGHASSLPIVAEAKDGRCFLLKYYLPPSPDRLYPAGVRPDDYARREAAFYRLLDSTDPERREFPAPKTVLIGPGDPPRWLLLEWIQGAAGPAEESLGMDHVFELLDKLQGVPTERLLGRRGLPLNHWHPIGYLEGIRQMYDAVLFAIGDQRWRQLQLFFDEAVRWTDNRKPVLVHGDFSESNIVIDPEGRPHLIDFERIGLGNVDHDLAWFWIHSPRHQEWKKQLILRWFGGRVGGDRIRAEWGIRTALAYLAVRRLRFGYLTFGDEDPRRSANLALLDAALAGGRELFPY